VADLYAALRYPMPPALKELVDAASDDIRQRET